MGKGGQRRTVFSMERTAKIKRILVTGCCGFIGSNFVRYELEADPAIEITNLDALTYAGNPDNLAEIAKHPRYRFELGDISDRTRVNIAGGGLSVTGNGSVSGPGVFLYNAGSNYLGTGGPSAASISAATATSTCPP